MSLGALCILATADGMIRHFQSVAGSAIFRHGNFRAIYGTVPGAWNQLLSVCVRCCKLAAGVVEPPCRSVVVGWWSALGWSLRHRQLRIRLHLSAVELLQLQETDLDSLDLPWSRTQIRYDQLIGCNPGD